VLEVDREGILLDGSRRLVEISRLDRVDADRTVGRLQEIDSFVTNRFLLECLQDLRIQARSRSTSRTLKKRIRSNRG
jgi:hypothetical protein